MELERWRSRIDAFHSGFNAAAARRKSGGNGNPSITHPTSGVKEEEGDFEDEGLTCGGCGASVGRSQSQWCGACRCTAYCSKECQRTGWKLRGHKAACKLLARAKALPPADPSRGYVVQIKLVGRSGLGDWAERLEKGDQPEVAGVHRQMAAVLAPRERVLFALEARSHFLLKFELIPPTKRLEAHDLALFTLQAILEPTADIPTLNMPRERPQRPYAIWIPSDEDDAPGPLDLGLGDGLGLGLGGSNGSGGGIVKRPMARPVGQLLGGAGLATSNWYIGSGHCAEAALRFDMYGGPGGTQRVGDRLINLFASLDPDAYSEDEDNDEDEDEEEERHRAGAAASLRQQTQQQTQWRLRVLMIAGMHMFGPDAGEGDDPLLAATAAALRGCGGAEVEVVMYRKGKEAGGPRNAQEALARRLWSGGNVGGGGGGDGDGGYDACVVLGLGSGDDFKPRRPTHPWGTGPWRDALTEWVRGGGVLVMHGERAAAAVAREFFGLSWTMEGDWYRRTDHKLNRANTLLGDLARRLPTDYNVKACMLSDVPPMERIYATAPGAMAHSLVPFMAGAAVDAGRTAMAAARVGDGAVAFFGDVNWEAPTMAAMVDLTQQLVSTCRRRTGGSS